MDWKSSPAAGVSLQPDQGCGVVFQFSQSGFPECDEVARIRPSDYYIEENNIIYRLFVYI